MRCGHGEQADACADQLAAFLAGPGQGLGPSLEHASLLTNAAMQHLRRGDPAAARSLLERAGAMARECQAPPLLRGQIDLNRGQAEEALGAIGPAAARYRAAFELLQSCDAAPELLGVAATHLVNLRSRHPEQGSELDLGDAIDDLSESLSGRPDLRARLLIAHGQSLFDAQEIEDAEFALDQAVQCALEAFPEGAVERFDARVGLSRALQALDDWDGALEHLEAAFDELHRARGGEDPYTRAIREELGALYRRLGDTDAEQELRFRR